jgi:hypothetical protein
MYGTVGDGCTGRIKMLEEKVMSAVHMWQKK